MWKKFMINYLIKILENRWVPLRIEIWTQMNRKRLGGLCAKFLNDAFFWEMLKKKKNIFLSCCLNTYLQYTYIVFKTRRTINDIFGWTKDGRFFTVACVLCVPPLRMEWWWLLFVASNCPRLLSSTGRWGTIADITSCLPELPRAFTMWSPGLSLS